MTTKRWVGGAAGVFDLWTVTLSGTVVSQTYTMTINGKSITFTSTASGPGSTVNDILTALVALWNATNPAPPQEFQELTAAGVGTVGSFTGMTLTGDTVGKPSLISVATGGGATFSIANTTPATGPNHFNNAANWSTGTAPANGDNLVFDNGNVPCLYGISTSLTGTTVNVQPGYGATIGLPQVNVDATTSYFEYRPTELTVAGGTAIINSSSLTRCNLAFGANLATVQVLQTGRRPNKSVPTVLISGGNGSSSLAITSGDVATAFYTGQTADFPTISTSFQTNALNDVTLYCGPGTTLGTVNMNGGTLTTNNAVTTLNQGPSGGTLIVAAGAVTTLNINAGTCIYSSTGALGTATVSGNGLLDFSRDPSAKTVTNPIKLYGDNAWVDDSLRVVNSGTVSVTTFQTTAINVRHGAGSVISCA